MSQIAPVIQVIKLNPVNLPETSVPGAAVVPEAIWWKNWTKRKVLTVFLALFPAIFLSFYFAFLAADRYTSETKLFVRSVRSAQGALSSAVSDATAGRSPADAHAVREFLLSRDALAKLEQGKVFTTALKGAGWDIFWRYPGLFRSANCERLYDFYRSMIDVVFDSTTGVTTVTLQGFSPKDITEMSRLLAQNAESLLNSMEQRSKKAAVDAAARQVALANEKNLAAVDALRVFREKELVLDPVKQSEGLFATISRLYLTQAEANARLKSIMTTVPNSPEIASIRTHIAAISDQIAAERATIAGAATALAPIIARFELLSMENEFSTRLLVNALIELESVEQDLRKQSLFLEVIAGPSQPDYPANPKRLLMILVSLLVNVLLVMLARMMLKDVFEHAGR